MNEFENRNEPRKEQVGTELGKAEWSTAMGMAISG